MTKAVIYLRSTTANRDQADRQSGSVRAYLRERGLRATAIYREEGQPGSARASLLGAASRGETTTSPSPA